MSIKQAVEMTPLAVLVFLILKRKINYYREKGELQTDGSFWYSDKQLFEEVNRWQLNESLTTVKRAKKILVLRGNIRIKTEPKSGVKKTYYWIEKDLIEPPIKDEPKKETSKNKNYDSIIESRLGKIATKDMIKAVLREMPKKLWWKVPKFLQIRYPGGGMQTYYEAEKEIENELSSPQADTHTIKESDSSPQMNAYQSKNEVLPVQNQVPTSPKMGGDQSTGDTPNISNIYKQDILSKIDKQESQVSHYYLTVYQLEEKLKENNNDVESTKNFFLKEGYTTNQINETFEKLTAKV